MRSIIGRYRKRSKDHVARCPFCRQLNMFAGEMTSKCQHTYEIVAEKRVTFYFAKNVMPMKIG